MESLLAYQRDVGNRIAKAHINFKKSSKDRLTQAHVSSRLEVLQGLWSEFKAGHRNLIQKSDPKLLNKDDYITEDLYEKTEQEVEVFTHSLQRVLSTFQSVTEENVKTDHNANVKLPKINIPIFSGHYSEWITFKDLFQSMIHTNKGLDNVQKLQYLKGYLSGEAAQLIKYIPVSEANYEKCWHTLEKHFSNKKYLSHCILKRLLGQRHSTTESATSLKELLNTSMDCLNALENLGVDVSTWDIIIIHLLSCKLDPESRKHWELHVASNVQPDSLPTFDQFKEYLSNRYRALEFLETNKSKSQSRVPTVTSRVLHSTTEVQNKKCDFCGETHKLCFCKRFYSLDYDKRREFVMAKRMCFNCLGSNHSVKACQIPTNCKVCNKRHHTSLHPVNGPSSMVNVGQVEQKGFESNRSSNNTTKISDSSQRDSSLPIVSSHMAHCAKSQGTGQPGQVLLATAMIEAESTTGRYQLVRALLDQGSQASFIAESTVQALGLKKVTVNSSISGLGGNSTIVSRQMVVINLRSRLNPDYQFKVNAYVLKNITNEIPGQKIFVKNHIELQQLGLADPAYNIPNRIDILLGAEIYSQILREGIWRGPMGSPIAQCTTLGWIISGPVNQSIQNNNITVLHATQMENFELKQFWELESESLLNTKILTVEEQKCEELFAATTRRNQDGHYVVKLPFRESNPTCKNGDSREIAINRFKGLERKFKINPEFKERYTEVINEYLDMGHMKLVPEPLANLSQAVYLPHHAVVREDKVTTKVRVVFDASCKNKNGVSLNDTLMVGPTLQPELRHLLMTWRTHPICLVGDIVKMYRMVFLADEDCDYQRIIWRDEKGQLCDYKLLTVTFGTASAPYLAVKCLNQVAIDHQEEHPIAAERVPTEYYVDDWMSGCESIEEGIHLVQEMEKLLKKGGFTLQKFTSNHNKLVEILEQRVKEDNLEQNISRNYEVKLDNSIMKILGLTWNREHDEFQYVVNLPPLSSPITKRKIIADVSRLFDPLGWLAPCIIIAKIFIQRLWIAGTGWDEEPPSEIIEDWCTYREELTRLTAYSIPRWVHTSSSDVVVELHGFSDASMRAYSAVVYVRVVDQSGHIHVGIINAKTRVAPVKQVSIPRLELCGAVLLAKLLVETAKVLKIEMSKVKAWTDSTIVLAWLNKHASNWKTFVANRVAEIQTTLESSQWFHVPTNDNPADCASRGLQPADLINNDMWKLGPRFLWERNITYTKLKENNTHEEESLHAHVSTVSDHTIFERFSCLQRMLRVVAYCRRFLKGTGRSTHLNRVEIDQALTSCIKKVQMDNFKEEYSQLQTTGSTTLKSSKIKSLCPYLDQNGIMRVTGRLQASSVPECTKHPIILPHDSHFTKLVVADAHKSTLHGGIQLMINYIRSKYWILGIKSLVRQHVRKCAICVRQRAQVQTPFMGSLPAVRCTPARAFLHSGVDYAGPIRLRTTKGRGHRTYKGYICLFICLATKAIHLEVVSDMSTQAFLAAFRRFVSRRGNCAQLWSDNGTTFVGASKELQQLKLMQTEAVPLLEAHGTEWHFIPPHAPNFGGVWEAGVKSTKYHLRRILGESSLTFEEMSTLLSQIEACLNSRPLTLDSSDPSDPRPLTPGHFLVGGPLIAVPEANDYFSSNVSSLSRWQYIQKMLQGFWRRWSQEYLSNLMNRYKWHQRIPEMQVGDVVLIKEDNLPPSSWLMGRIVEKHSGSHNTTRVVTVQTRPGHTIKRPVSKLCVLPTD